jgi:hypothetical protein
VLVDELTVPALLHPNPGNCATAVSDALPGGLGQIGLAVVVG